MDAGDLDQAMADFDRAVELDPAYAEPYNSRGFIFAERGDIEQAIADYGKAIEVDRDYASAYANRGTASLKLGDVDRAVADLDKAIELDRAYASAPVTRTMLSWASGGPSEFANPAWNLGAFARTVEDLEEALSSTGDPGLASRLEEIVAYLSSRSKTEAE